VTVVAQQQDGGMPRLATQLNHLFATVPRPGGRDLWTNEDAASAMTETGVAMSAAYLSQLRTGKRDNPSARHLAAIARLFEVPMEYFFDPEVAAKIDADLRLLVAVRDAGVHTIALRAQGLSEESLSGVAGMIEHIRRLERIPDQPPDTE
jgi:hypothetical protein